MSAITATDRPSSLGLGFGFGLIAAVACLAAFGPLLVSADPNAQDLVRVLDAPSPVHPLGTDQLGRDMLARLVHGAARSCGLALACVVSATALGAALGLIAAYSGRLGDILIMRFVDLMLAFPGILLALVIAGFLGGGVAPLLIGITVSLAPQFARISRAVALGVLAEAHVEAAELAGFPRRTILLRHVAPAVWRQIATLATLALGSAVISISALGFLGLGLQPPIPEWGAMIGELLPYLSEAGVQIATPCLAIFAAVLGATLVGQALAERMGGAV